MKDLQSKKSEPSLYGIVHSNRNFKDKDSWGKNQFNSSFPVALCCYMRDKGHTAMYVSVKKGIPGVSEMSFDDVFGTNLPNAQLKFLFESPYDPYREYVEDAMEKIDVVITEAESGKYLMPLEIKLTTLPDNGTSSLPESEYGSEIVVRSATMRYVALGMASRLNAQQREDVRKIFHPVCVDIQDWENVFEMRQRREAIFKALDTFLIKYEKLQCPLVMQPVWKTKGKSPELADNCLDVFVWSDFALARCLFMDDQGGSDEITAAQGRLFQLVRFLYEFSARGRVFQHPIFDGMRYDDEEEDVSSTKIAFRHVSQLLQNVRFKNPVVRKRELKNIVSDGGKSLLRPSYGFFDMVFAAPKRCA